MLGIIDRFEGELVIIELEDNSVVNMEKRKIPMEAREGYVLNIGDNITINYQETEKRRSKISDLTKNLWI